MTQPDAEPTEELLQHKCTGCGRLFRSETELHQHEHTCSRHRGEIL